MMPHPHETHGARPAIPRLPRIPGTNVFPCSFAQERMWLMSQRYPENPYYNEAMSLRAKGALDARVLRRCLDTLSIRHEALRTTLVMRDGVLVQVIAPQPSIRLRIVDVSALKKPARDAAIQRIRRDARRQPFELARGPLVRAALVRLSTDDHVFALSAHHAAADAWSLAIFLDELRALYSAYVAGRPPAFDTLSIQYADVVAWERGRVESGTLAPALEHWRSQLADAPALHIPTDGRRRGDEPTRSGIVELNLQAPLVPRLRRLAHESRASLFMTLLAAWSLFLSRYCGQDDIVIGSPVANRGRVECEKVIGCLTNMVALRCRVTGTPTFRQWLDRVREVCVAAYAHQDWPFDKLIEALRPSRLSSRNPLIDSVLVVDHRPAKTWSLPGLTLSAMEEDETAAPAKFDLGLAVYDHGPVLTAKWTFDPVLFERETIESIARSWSGLIAAIVEQPDLRISDYPLSALDSGRATPTPRTDPHEGLHYAFEHQAALRPLAPAVSDRGRTVTYADLNRFATAFATRLRKMGVGLEQRIALLLEPSAELVAAMIGTLKAGGMYVPLDPRHPIERLTYVIADARPRVLITTRALQPLASVAVPHILLVDDLEGASEASAAAPAWNGTPAAAAYMIYTSGSTGRPKGTVVTHANVTRLLRMTESEFGFGPDDVWTFFHSPAFDFSVWEIWGALSYGGRLVVTPPLVARSPREFHALVRDEGVTVLNQTPAAFLQFVRADEESAADVAPRLRHVIFGGEELKPEALRSWFARHGDERPRLVNMYGITETTVHVTFRALAAADAWRDRRSPVGRPIRDLRAHVLDAGMMPLPAGAAGELYVGGPGVSRGYWKRPDLTAERFVPDPFGEPGDRFYRTGDLMRRRHDDGLEYLGRADDQVKIRGHRIEPGEIAALLQQHPAVRQAVVVMREDSAGERYLLGYCAPAPDHAIDITALRNHLRARVPDYMMPRALVALDAMPLTANGKVDRQALPAPPLHEADNDPHGPRSAVEEILCGIAADVLGCASVGGGDNFFDLGGHSLLATQVTSRAREALGVDVPLRWIFEHPTMASMAARVEAARRTGAAPSARLARVVPGDDPVPLSFAQQRLWFMDQLEPGDPSYHVAKVQRLRGPLDVAAIRGAFREIERRHEVLRTSFPADRGEPEQRVARASASPLTIPLVDLTTIETSRAFATARRLAASASARPFDLSRGPVWRVELVRLAPDDHLLIVIMHHIVSDGWSAGLMVRELTALYEALHDGRATGLASLRVQYADFTRWQRAWLTGDVLEAQRRYWRERLAGLEVVRLPADYERREDAAHRQGIVGLRIDEPVTQALHVLARREGATVFMVLLAALHVLVGRWTGRVDVAIGTDVANRTREETEVLIGFFVNQLVLRVELDAALSFRELLARVRELTLEAYANQDVPFEQVVDDLALSRDGGRPSPFHVKLVLQNAPDVPLRLPGLDHDDVALPTSRAKLDVLLMAWDRGRIIEGWLEYDASVLKRGSAARFLAQYCTLLRHASQDPSRAVADIPLVSDEPDRRLTSAFA